MDIHALPCFKYVRQLNKPLPLSYPANPESIGEHLKKRRLDLKLLQADVASKFNVSEDCVTNWENNHSQPQIRYYPEIIKFLGYSPLKFDNGTLAGRIQLYRWRNGLTNTDLGKRLGVHGSTVLDWEKDKRMPKPDMIERLENLFLSNSAI